MVIFAQIRVIRGKQKCGSVMIYLSPEEVVRLLSIVIAMVCAGHAPRPRSGMGRDERSDVPGEGSRCFGRADGPPPKNSL